MQSTLTRMEEELKSKTEELADHLKEEKQLRQEARNVAEKNRDLQHRQQLLDAEAQLELIKDVILREKAF